MVMGNQIILIYLYLKQKMKKWQILKIKIKKLKD